MWRPPSHSPEVHTLTREETRYSAGLLSECRAEHLSGLVHLLRFGLASSGDASEACVAAAWLLNAARHPSLPRIQPYERDDGSGFPHCDADWLEERTPTQPYGTPLDSGRRAQRQRNARKPSRPEGPMKGQLLTALTSMGAVPLRCPLGVESPEGAGDAERCVAWLSEQLSAGTPSLVLVSTPERESLALALALNAHRRRLFVCKLSGGKARLEWLSLDKLLTLAPGAEAGVELIGLERARTSEARRSDGNYRGGKVLYLDERAGAELLGGAEGLGVLAYAALHGQNQRDLSSCQVSSLLSVALKKGTRSRVGAKAAGRLAGPGRASAPPLARLETTPASGELQARLRALAAQRLRAEKGLDFRFRGLCLAELAELAASVGLEVQPCELFEGAEKKKLVVDAFRSAARGALGRTIVNFCREALDQRGGGHHAVLVAYHPDEDLFLVDDPAGFKMPPYWVSTRELVRAMATLDETPGVQRYRGYLVVRGEAGSLDAGNDPFGADGPDSDELSTSVVLHRRRSS